MKLTCPGCGAVASADTWTNDELCRETLAVITRLPAPLPKATPGYLSLFRPGKQALTWKKALRLALEIEQLVGCGYVHVQGKVDKNCPPSLWARAMEQMVEQRLSLRLPMASHIYLEKIAWDLANGADSQMEKRQAGTATQTRVRPDNGSVLQRDPLEKARREYDEKVARGEIAPVAAINVSGILKGFE